MDLEDFQNANKDHYNDVFQKSDEACDCPDIFNDRLQQDEQQDEIKSDMVDCHRERVQEQ